METIYRKLDRSNQLRLATSSENDIPEKYELLWTANKLTLSPHVTEKSCIVRKTYKGQIIIPKIVTETIGLTKIVKLVKTDDGIIYVYPVYNGRCEFCNGRDDLLEYEEHKFCRQCIQKIINHFGGQNCDK